MNTLANITKGTAGVVGIEAVEQASQIVPIESGSWLSAVTQLIVAVATIFSLFKKRR